MKMRIKTKYEVKFLGFGNIHGHVLKTNNISKNRGKGIDVLIATVFSLLTICAM